MKRWLLRTALAVCAMSVTAWPVVAQPKVEVAPRSPVAPRTVAVIGEASTNVRPDIAILTFAVEIRNQNTTQAVLVNHRTTNKIVDEIEKSGTAASDIAVGNYRMEYVVDTFTPALGTNQPVEFQVEQHGTYKVTTEIVVTVHNLSFVPRLFNVAILAGVDQIGRVEYKSSRLAEIESQLVPQAIKNARQKAETLARDSGLQLGEPLRVAELPNGSATVKVLAGMTGSGQTAPPTLEVWKRVRIVFAATKASG